MSVSLCLQLFVCVVNCHLILLYLFFFKQKTAYEMRISDWSSDVCSSDLITGYSKSLGPSNGACIDMKNGSFLRPAGCSTRGPANGAFACRFLAGAPPETPLKNRS